MRSVSETTGATPWTVLQEVADGSRKLAGVSDLVDRFRQVRDRLSELDGLRGQELLDALFPLSEPWALPLRTLAETFWKMIARLRSFSMASVPALFDRSFQSMLTT